MAEMLAGSPLQPSACWHSQALRVGVPLELKGLDGKLSNPGFLAKAPAQLVEQEKAKLEVNKDTLAKLNARIADLQNM